MKRCLSLAYALLLLSMAGCTPDREPMAIRYTAVNDVYANYVFNFKNDAAGIKQLYDFAVKDLEAGKHYRDSLSKTAAHDPHESLPAKAEPVVFYIPPGFIKGQPDRKDILLSCYPDEDTFDLKAIVVFACDQDGATDMDCIAAGRTPDSCILRVTRPALSLCVLKSVLEKIQRLRYHLAQPSFTYKIQDKGGRELLHVRYTGKGQVLKLLFPQ